MKRYYSDATADDLGWILGPTAQLVGVVTRTRFVAAPGEGYFSPERLFLIEKSCAGINFVIAAFGMLTFARLQRAEGTFSGARLLAVSLAASYTAAVIVNATRITIAMCLAAHPVALSTFTAAEVHRIEGIVVYFGGLVLLYELASGSRRVLLPLAWYYAVTLVIPIANGASLSDASFVKHALVVLVLPVVLIVAACAIREIARTAARTCAAQRARAIIVEHLLDVLGGRALLRRRVDAHDRGVVGKRVGVGPGPIGVAGLGDDECGGDEDGREDEKSFHRVVTGP
jgi:exosortase K